ncbi:MAG: hypothetical protein IKP86_13185 [Anaerolineaceae bacterium]|nr:hypothetical protein [Anaerolineaceae bacterium]
MQISWQLNEQKGTQELRSGENRVIAKVTPGTVIRQAEAGLIFPAAEKMFFNGFQSWTHCPEYAPSDKIRLPKALPRLICRALSLDHFADYHFVQYPNRRGVLHGISYCYFRDGNRYRLLASLDERPGYTVFRYDCREALLTLKRDCAGTAAGEENFHVFDLFYMEGSE